MVLIATGEPPAPGVPSSLRDEYARYALRVPGDQAKGRSIFAAHEGTKCIRCHRVGGEGGSIGPDLSNIGGKFARPHLIESILEPSRQIVEGYRSVIIATSDGRVLTGVVKGESSERLIIVDVNACEHTIRSSDIE